MAPMKIEQLLMYGSEEELELNKAQFLNYIKRKLIENNINLNGTDGRLFTMVAERGVLTQKGYVYNTQPKLIVEELGCSLSTFYRILKKYKRNNFGFSTESTYGSSARLQCIWRWGDLPV